MKYITLIIIILSMGMLSARPNVYPVTTLVEQFGATWCAGCTVASEGLSVIDADTHNGEAIFTRLYTESGDLSNPEIDARFSHYQVFGLPEVIFNGKSRVPGAGTGIADGYFYHHTLKHHRYATSPIMMNTTEFNPNNGAFSGNVIMLDGEVNIIGATIYYYLIEDDVSTEATHVVRSVVSEPFDLSGLNNSYSFNTQFTVSPAWNAAHLWAVAFVQMPNNAIIQSVSTLPLPNYNFRVAMPFDMHIVGPAGGVIYNSQPFWFFNLGMSDNYTVRIEVDSAPNDWYFNYCDEDGICYSGNNDNPLSLGGGESANFHLNLWVGTPGVAYFHYEITSPNLGTYIVPFIYQAVVVEIADPIAVPAALSITGAYPNPFRDSATIEYSSAKAGAFDRLEIFNLKGQKVDSLPLSSTAQGLNTVKWQPQAQLPAGIYLYRLAGNPAQTGRLLRTK